MNDALKQFAKDSLIEGLSKCTEAQIQLFKRLYSPNNLHLTISEVVENMPEEKLDWAMQQVQRTLIKKEGIYAYS